MPKNHHPDLEKSARRLVLRRLQSFVREQMAQAGEKGNKDISQADFADIVGFSQSTLSRLLAKEPSEPDVPTLIKLARHAQTDIRDLIALISPDDVLRDVSPDNLRLALQLNGLSDRKRKLLDSFLSTLIDEFDEL